jgi:hypothetical protein
MLPSEFWSPTAQVAFRDMQNFPLQLTTRMIGGVNTSILRSSAGTPLKTLIATYPKVAKDLIGCALSSTQMIHDDVTGTDFWGWWGLAPNWLTAPINGSANVDAQQWLTGCMVARLNKYGVEVGILLEGDTGAIQTNATWDPLMPYNESNVFGNMFNSTKPISNTAPAFNAYLCREGYLASTCPGDQGITYARSRVCDNAPYTCGLVDIGLCDPTIGGSLGSCVVGSTTEYWKCKGGSASGFYDYHTVGVQLETALNPNTSCY